MRILLALAALLATPAALLATPAAAQDPVSPKGEAQLARLLDGRVAGKPVNCIPFTQLRSSNVVDGTAIVYGSGSRVYVNRPRIGADQLDDNVILVTRTSLSSLCSIDTINLLDRNSRFFRGFVTLGEFVPYTRVRAEKTRG